MPEMPERPDLDQLRRQARELLRAAAAGDPDAIGRLRRASSATATLSIAQLAVAREHGFPSWSALKAEVDRRRAAAAARPGGADQRRSGAHPSPLEPLSSWSYAGGAAIEVTTGVLAPNVLVVDAEQAVLHATLQPSGGPAVTEGGAFSELTRLGRRLGLPFAPRRHLGVPPVLEELVAVDNDGGTYAVRVGMSSEASNAHTGQPVGAVHLRCRVEPVPPRTVLWLELHSQAGATTRLVRSSRVTAEVDTLVQTAMPDSREQELEGLIRSLVEVSLIAGDRGGDLVARQCTQALARATEIERSGASAAAGDLVGQLRALCEMFSGGRSTADLSGPWQRVFEVADRTDGLPLHLDITAVLPRIGDVAVRLDSLISEPDLWRLHLRTMPGWWSYSEDRRTKRAAVSLRADDDLGGTYLAIFDGSTGRGDHEQLAIRFRPRLDPSAQHLVLTFQGADHKVRVRLPLSSGDLL